MNIKGVILVHQSMWLKMDNMGIIRSVYLRRLWIWESQIGIVPG